MNPKILDQFAKLGVRVKIQAGGGIGFGGSSVGVRVHVQTDAAGEHFVLRRAHDVEFEIPDVRPGDRHLLLTARLADARNKRARPATFLCGHDERHWFVAAVPEDSPATTVQEAKDALKPREVWDSIREYRVPLGDRDKRRTAGFVRQGEWFFLPEPGFAVDEKLVLRWEPLRRGNGGKPHWTEFLYRTGGETVYVCTRHPNGVTEAQYKGILSGNPAAKRWGWRSR